MRLDHHGYATNSTLRPLIQDADAHNAIVNVAQYIPKQAVRLSKVREAARY